MVTPPAGGRLISPVKRSVFSPDQPNQRPPVFAQRRRQRHRQPALRACRAVARVATETRLEMTIRRLIGPQLHGPATAAPRN